MSILQVGDKVKVNIPDSSDPDHRYHGEIGTVTAIIVDDLGQLTGHSNDDYLYSVEFYNQSLGSMDFRHQDLIEVRL